MFEAAEFSGDVTFEKVVFKGESNFRRARVDGYATFDKARFYGPPQFDGIMLSLGKAGISGLEGDLQDMLP